MLCWDECGCSTCTLLCSNRKVGSRKKYFQAVFFKHFFSKVRDYLKSESLSPKALLLLDNAPSHPSCDTLVSSEGKIKCMFMPPIVTSLIQPMGQGVLENVKRRYKRD